MEITTILLAMAILFLRWSTVCWTQNVTLPLVGIRNATKFYYPFFDLNLTQTIDTLEFFGSAHVDNEQKEVELTSYLTANTTPYGGFMRAHPIAFYDPPTSIASTLTISFSIIFQIDISSQPGATTSLLGTGLLFFFADNITSLGKDGMHFGMLPIEPDAARLTNVFGIEFDTHLDEDVNDPDNNHVGIDFNEAKSLVTCSLNETGIIMDHSLVTAWIEYSDFRKRIEVRISLTDDRPVDPLCFLENMDIRSFLSQSMFVGFAAMGTASIQSHKVAYWTMETYAWNPPPPPPSPPPPSPPPPPPTILGEILYFKSWVFMKITLYSFFFGPLFDTGIIFCIMRVTECGQRKMVEWYETIDKHLAKKHKGLKKLWDRICGLWLCLVLCTIPRHKPRTPLEKAQQELLEREWLKTCGCGWLLAGLPPVVMPKPEAPTSPGVATTQKGPVKRTPMPGAQMGPMAAMQTGPMNPFQWRLPWQRAQPIQPGQLPPGGLPPSSSPGLPPGPGLPPR